MNYFVYAIGLTSLDELPPDIRELVVQRVIVHPSPEEIEDIRRRVVACNEALPDDSTLDVLFMDELQDHEHYFEFH